MSPDPGGPFLTLLHKALSHELPNHLVAIGGLARMLELEAGERLGDGREYLTRLGAAGQRCNQLVKELAEVVRLARLPQSNEPTALAEVIRDAVEELRPRFPDCRVQLRFAENALTATIPAAALRFALVQVLKNTFEAAPPGPIDVDSRLESGKIVLGIRHPGRAMTEAERAKLFEPFAGPNLAMVAAVLACHGGQIEVESTLDDETTFQVRLHP